MDLSQITIDSIVITIAYLVLPFWGMWAGVRQHNAWRRCLAAARVQVATIRD
jgi:hypothetical protein